METISWAPSIIDVSNLDADATLTIAVDFTRAAEAADINRIVLAAHWADLHGELDRADRSVALPGAERLVPLGGDGTPAVAEFAPAELGAVMGASLYSASALIADALDLRHRLPILWARICAGEVKPWVGRKVAAATRAVPFDAMRSLDARVSAWADRLTWSRLDDIVQAAVIAADPEQAEADVEAARSESGVWLGQEVEHGTRTAFIRADAVDLDAFDASLEAIADSLAGLGDTSSRDVRRARGVGILADPQTALDLTGDSTGATTDETVDDRSEPSVERTPSRRSRPAACLYVHVSADTLAGDADNRVARVESIGPATLGQVRRWLGDRDVVVKPVIDLAGVAPADGYEIPDRLREAVHLIAPADGFPFASGVSRRTDTDHTIEYLAPDKGGGTGQTRVGNLAKLTRRPHRVKTHGRWQVRQPYPGVMIWRSPHGRMFLVDHTGTRRIR
jgi:hypothetical protein